jgi:hypothetical protein
MKKKESSVLDKPHSGQELSTIGYEFRVSGSAIYIKQGVVKQKHTYNKAGC